MLIPAPMHLDTDLLSSDADGNVVVPLVRLEKDSANSMTSFFVDNGTNTVA